MVCVVMVTIVIQYWSVLEFKGERKAQNPVRIIWCGVRVNECLHLALVV